MAEASWQSRLEFLTMQVDDFWEDMMDFGEFAVP